MEKQETGLRKFFAIFGISLAAAALLVFFGYPFLVGIGAINYDMPVSQPEENIDSVQLLITEEEPYVLVGVLPDDKIEGFYKDLVQTRAYKYSNDPRLTPGKWSVKICYMDGSYDLYSLGFLSLYDADGESKSLKGWYYVSSRDMARLIEKHFYYKIID